ncbi:MAG TPA: YerC/YecD family TrpR-related protein [Candidatus Saccharimonadales bacterium]|nr:YerC/YecD family TrpR-related protein [Candidatus Saccharimonadales bacterium]
MDYLHTSDARELFKAFMSLDSYDEYRKFLRDLLTEAELKEFINRWKVARMLERKIPYEKITQETGMSSTTIARIQKWKEQGMGGYQLMLERIKKK